MTWFDAAMVALKRPSVVAHRVRLILENPYFRLCRVTWLSKLTGASTEEIQKYIREVEHDGNFLRDIRSAFERYTLYFPLPTDFMVTKSGGSMFFHFVSLYAFTRLVQPTSVVETGGTPGKSSAFILRALQRNRSGHLYTIDLPPCEGNANLRPAEVHDFRPPDVRPNWSVPEYLMDRQTLLIGAAQERLPRLLNELGEIDVFIHDSDHSYEHMQWELETAYPFVRAGGFLWCDDIGANMAWQDFCARHKLVNLDFTSHLGVARKSTI